jgi:hypothetical protein
MALIGDITIEPQDDGSVKVDCSKLQGTDAEIMEMLEGLRKDLGGTKLVVEKHIHKHGHSHSHSDKVHQH